MSNYADHILSTPDTDSDLELMTPEQYVAQNFCALCSEHWQEHSDDGECPTFRMNADVMEELNT